MTASDQPRYGATTAAGATGAGAQEMNGVAASNRASAQARRQGHDERCVAEGGGAGSFPRPRITSPDGGMGRLRGGRATSPTRPHHRRFLRLGREHPAPPLLTANVLKGCPPEEGCALIQVNLVVCAGS